MRLRRYNEEDRQAVWELHNLALEQTGAHLGNGPWDDDLGAIAATYLESGGEFLVGVEDERIVGMGALRDRDGRRAEIRRMRVHPALQRRGFGRRLLHRLERRAAELGYETLVLDTTAQQQAAQALYRSEGLQGDRPRPGGSLRAHPVREAHSLTLSRQAAPTAEQLTACAERAGRRRDGAVLSASLVAAG